MIAGRGVVGDGPIGGDGVFETLHYFPGHRPRDLSLFYGDDEALDQFGFAVVGEFPEFNMGTPRADSSHRIKS